MGLFVIFYVAMRIKLQGQTPYMESIKWKIQNNYFQNKGASAWLNFDVPYEITCNSCAAFQNAKLAFEAIRKMDLDGVLTAGEKINVMELASGVGLFAINFIKQFEEICLKNGANYHTRLVFFLTDYAEINVRDAKKNTYLADLESSGLVRFAVVDAINPSTMKDLETGEKIENIKFSAVIANYMHCVLPVKILRKRYGNFYEKYISLYYDLKKKSRKIKNPKKFVDELLANPVKDSFLSNLVEKNRFKKIDGDVFFEDPMHFNVVKEGVDLFYLATIIYPFGSFNSIKNFLPLMKKGAIYVISDKGYASEDYMYGDNKCAPSLHGNSFAHCVNFPLLEIFAKKLGLNAYRTQNADYSLQTFVVDTSESDSLKKVFDDLFVDDNRNQNSADFISAAYDYEKNDDLNKAIKFMKKGAEMRPFDAKPYYKLGNYYMSKGEFSEALDFYSRGKQYDYFGLFDFNFEIGRAKYSLGLCKEALDFYNLSLEKFGNKLGNEFGDCEYTYYNIGLCYREMRDFAKMKEARKKVLEINPASELDVSALHQSPVSKDTGD